MAGISEETEISFFRAVKKNGVDEVGRMLREAPGLATMLKQENNAIAYACLQVNTHGANLPSCAGPQDILPLVQLLLDHGVDPNTRGNKGVMTALHYIANANDALSQVPITRLLVQHGAQPDANIEWDPTCTPLKQIPKPPPAVVEILRNAAAIRAAWEEEVAAAAAIPPIMALYPGMQLPAIFMKAIRYGREDDVRMVLESSRDDVINKAMGSAAPIEQAAIEISMAVPVTDDMSEEKRRQRQYWLDPACGMSMIRLLLNAGEDPNRRGSDTSISAVQFGSDANDRDLVVLLLAHGADPNVRDLDGFTAMTAAQHAHNEGMVEIIAAAAEIRAHFLATGRAEWPLVPEDEPAPVVPVPEPPPEDDYQPVVVYGPRVEDRVKRIKTRCLEISKQAGRPNKQSEVYKTGVKCHVPQPPVVDPQPPPSDGSAAPPPSPEKKQYIKEREKFIASTIARLHGTSPLDWRHKTLQIMFSVNGAWQQGMDWGGLTKAFVKFMSDCLFDKDLPNTLFVPLTTEDDADELVGIPKVASLWRMKSDVELAKIDDWQSRMQWVGRFLAYCLWTGEAVNMPLLPSVYSYLLGNDEPHWRDLMLDAPQKYKNYSAMLHMTPDDIENMWLDMSISRNPDDPMCPDMIDLVEGGSDISVTSANVHEYVRLSSFAEMITVRKEGLDVLRAGFYEIIDAETLGFIHDEGITWRELQLLVNGVAEVDVKALQQAAIYRGCNMGSQKCKWFFEVLAKWQEGEPACNYPRVRTALEEERAAAQQAGREPFGKQAQLVLKAFEYVTGTDRAPAGGYKNLLDKAGNKCPFTIYNFDDVRNEMPRAHTCFNKIDLPDYDNREKLAEELSKAIFFGMGFGDA